jgi:hypothetical protein
MIKKGNRLVFYLVSSGVLFFLSALIFVGNYFAITLRVLKEPSQAHREYAAYDSWSGFFIVVLCVSGFVFYSAILHLIKEKKAKEKALREKSPPL